MDPSSISLLDPLGQQAFPELATALRARVLPILSEWSRQIRQAIPVLQGLPEDAVIDHLPLILPQIATALESTDSVEIHRLMTFSPEQGMTRFNQKYDIRELFEEDRLLRLIIINETTAGLTRPMTPTEQSALNVAIDLMLQQSVVSYVDEQQERLKRASEGELKHLSFLSHDLRNNLNSVTLHLQLLRQQLADWPEPAEALQTIDMAQQAILETVGGMSRLLQEERIKQTRGELEKKPIDLHKFATTICRRHDPEAQKKGLAIIVEVPPGLTIDTDAEMLTIVLQNLLGNAIKYSHSGTVRVSARSGDNDDCYLIVRDEGPGISPQHVQRIFQAFSRGDTHDEEGVGLGLSIASRAATALGGTLTVESTLGDGSTFTLRLPCKSS